MSLGREHEKIKLTRLEIPVLSSTNIPVKIMSKRMSYKNICQNKVKK